MTEEYGLALVQTFLSRRGISIFMVSLDVLRDELVCNCPGFGVRGRCKHVRYVKDKMAEDDGALLISVPPEVDLAELTHREMVLMYGTPVVLS